MTPERRRLSRRRAVCGLGGWLGGVATHPLGALAAPSADSDDQALLADPDYAAGRAALHAGQAADALPRLQAALKRFPDAAELHNDLGYAHRKLRRLDEAFAHYQRALALRPDLRSAHEYIGEAYLMVNNLAKAEEHLAALRRLCLLPCEEHDDLARAIASYKATQARKAPGPG